ADHRAGAQREELVNELMNPGKDLARKLLEHLLKEARIDAEEAAHVLAIGLDTARAQTFPNNGSIGPSGELDVVGGFREAEFHGKGALKCFDTGPASANKRAVDIEENEFNHEKEKRRPRRAARAGKKDYFK